MVKYVRFASRNQGTTKPTNFLFKKFALRGRKYLIFKELSFVKKSKQ